jgi:hypothetical protein
MNESNSDLYETPQLLPVKIYNCFLCHRELNSERKFSSMLIYKKSKEEETIEYICCECFLLEHTDKHFLEKLINSIPYFGCTFCGKKCRDVSICISSTTYILNATCITTVCMEYFRRKIETNIPTTAKIEELCKHCQKSTKYDTMIKCKCKTFSYCSFKCLKKNRKIHKCTTSN